MKRLKKVSHKKSEFVGVKLTLEELNKIKQRALLYCNNNISEFMRYCALNYAIKEEDLEDAEEIKKHK